MPCKFAKFSPYEMDCVREISDRAVRLYAGLRVQRSKLDITMDLAAVHARVPLDLIGLMCAEDDDFAHDICGINRHIDHSTGKLTGCFRPRYALRAALAGKEGK